MSADPLQASPRSARGKFTADIARRVARGEHITLWGPRGSGKTTLLREVKRLLDARHCAYSVTTQCLDDITCTLERAYGDVATRGLTRRAARGRLWRAADVDRGILLLDHVTDVGTAMKGWLRRLRGGVVGIILALDVDSPRERERLRAWSLGCISVRMPPLTTRVIARQLTDCMRTSGVPQLSLMNRRTLVRAARGRPGWVVICAALAAHDRYWRDGQLKARLIAGDAELSLRGASDALLPGPGASRHGQRLAT